MLCCVALSVSVEPLHALGLLVEVVVDVLVLLRVAVLDVTPGATNSHTSNQWVHQCSICMHACILSH
jgi:hypothetical protein